MSSTDSVSRYWKEEWMTACSNGASETSFIDDALCNKLKQGISHELWTKDSVEWSYAMKYCINCIASHLSSLSHGIGGDALVVAVMDELCAILRAKGSALNNEHQQLMLDLVHKLLQTDVFWSQQSVICVFSWSVLYATSIDVALDMIAQLRRLILQPYLGKGVRVGVSQNVERCLAELLSALSVENGAHVAVLPEILLSVLCIDAVHLQGSSTFKELQTIARDCLHRLAQHCVATVGDASGMSSLRSNVMPCLPLLFLLEEHLQPHATRVLRYILNQSSILSNLYTDTDLLRGVDNDTLLLLLHHCKTIVNLFSDQLVRIQHRSHNRINDILTLLSKLIRQIKIHLGDIKELTDAVFALIEGWPELSSRLLYIFQGHLAEAQIIADVDALATFVTELYDEVLHTSLLGEEEAEVEVDVDMTSEKHDSIYSSSFSHSEHHSPVVEYYNDDDAEMDTKSLRVVYNVASSDEESSGEISSTRAQDIGSCNAALSTAAPFPSANIPVMTASSPAAPSEAHPSFAAAHASALLHISQPRTSQDILALQINKRPMPNEDSLSNKRLKHDEETTDSFQQNGKIKKLAGGENWLRKAMEDKKATNKQATTTEANKRTHQTAGKKSSGVASLRQRMLREKHAALLRDNDDTRSRDSSFAFEDLRRERGTDEKELSSLRAFPDALNIYNVSCAADLDADIPRVASSKPRAAPQAISINALMARMDHTTSSEKRKISGKNKFQIGHTFDIAVDVESVRLQFCDFALQKIVALLPTRAADDKSCTRPLLECVAQRFRDVGHYSGVFVPLIEEEVQAELKECISYSRALIRHQGVRNHSRCTYRQAQSARGEKTTAVFEVLQPCPEKAESKSLVSVRVKGASPFEKDDLILITHIDITERSISLGDLLAAGPCFGIVSRSSREDVAESERRLILPLINFPAPSTKWYCVYLTSLSTHLREYTAVHCVKSFGMMPLAPYILSASPICSAALLNDTITSIESRASNLQGPLQTSSDQAISSALLAKIDFLRLLKVDISVLGASNAPKRLRNVRTLLKQHERVCVQLSTLLNEWREKSKVDHKASTLSAMIGGNLAVIPEEIGCPQHLSSAVWRKFQMRFNSSQLYAIEYVSKPLHRVQDTRIALVQGPPGCGKTWCIIGMISAMMQPANGNGVSDKRLLVCAASNAAVDEVLCRLRQGIPTAGEENMNLRMIRIGRPVEGTGTDTSFIESITLDAQTEREVRNHAISRDLRKVTNEIAEQKRDLLKFSEADRRADVAKNIRVKLQTLRHQKQRLESKLAPVRNEARAGLLSRAHIIGCTLSGAAHAHLQEYVDAHNVTFDAVLIDEAAQATEPACLIPLRYGARTLVLVGDPRQLPAFVRSPVAQEKKLGMSLFERLEKANHEVVMLQVQYRMHPDIRAFPSAKFYANRLKDADGISKEVEQFSLTDNSITLVDPTRTRVICDIVRKGVPGYLNPVNFFDLRSEETLVGTSYRNETEARFIASLIDYYKECFGGYKVGIITAYRPQLAELKSHAALRENANVEVNTIDGFQGREKDVVIVSTVRSNRRGGIGFLDDERRLNVALTRAKRCLIVVGNIEVLEAHELWRSMLHSVREANGILHVPRSGEFTNLSNIAAYDAAKLGIIQRKMNETLA